MLVLLIRKIPCLSLSLSLCHAPQRATRGTKPIHNSQLKLSTGQTVKAPQLTKKINGEREKKNSTGRHNSQKKTARANTKKNQQRTQKKKARKDTTPKKKAPTKKAWEDTTLHVLSLSPLSPLTLSRSPASFKFVFSLYEAHTLVGRGSWDTFKNI